MFDFSNLAPNNGTANSPQWQQQTTQLPWVPPGMPDSRIVQASYDPSQQNQHMNYGDLFTAQNLGLNPPPMSGAQSPWQGMMGNTQPILTPQQPQVPPQLQHITDVLNQYTQNKSDQQSGNNFLTQILSNRVQPEAQDTSRSLLNSALTNSYSSPEQETAGRYEAQLAPYTSLLSNQMKAGTQYMNMSGGGTGVLVNRLMQENPGMTFQDALFRTQSGFKNGLQMDAQGNVIPMPGSPQAQGQVAFGKKLGEQQAVADTSKQIEQQKETGKNIAENQQSAVSTGDIVGLYGKLQQDAATAPSGLFESAIARGANLANVPTKGSIAQATFDADLNNLYLATIRSLKGTGRVMEQELIKIGESAPKSTDSNAVKIAKAQAHMQYYTERMKELGVDPSTGQQTQGDTQPDISTVGGQPVGGATHRYNPMTQQLEQLQ